MPVRRTESVKFATTPEARDRYKEAAAASDLPLADWLRRSVDEAAERAFENARKEAERKRRAARTRA